MNDSEKETEEPIFGETTEQIRENRRKLKVKYGKLFDAVAEILFRLDPVGINFEHNTDEYEPEAGTILPRLKNCDSVIEARKVIHEEFVRWFDLETAGNEESYAVIAGEIWAVWQKYRW
jgi:hypothetical protein